jgi:hypothetical protein
VPSIFLIGPSGGLTELNETEYESEALLQELLASHPRLLSGDSDAVEPPRWLLVKREMPLFSAGGSSGTWSVDHLFVDQLGVPTLVEVKRSSNTEIRRHVVGQMLDYAANAVVYWPIEQLRATFEARCEREGKGPNELIDQLVGQPDAAESFWTLVATNLQAQRIRLIFVADQIPPELRRIIEFLNGQMSPAEVLGLEVRQFEGGDLRTLVPRVIGSTADAEARKGTTSRPRRNDWTWEAYAEELRISPDRLAVGRALEERLDAAFLGVGRPVQRVRRQGYVAYQRKSGYNVALVDVQWRKPTRFAVKIPSDPASLGLASPYPALAADWDPNNNEWGWVVPSVADIPDLTFALLLALPFHPENGPMRVP